MNSIFACALIIFLIMDPFGKISSIIKCLKGIDAKSSRRILTREILIALVVTLLFNFLGEYIFDILQLSDATVSMTLGMILFLSAIKVLFPQPGDDGIRKPEGDLFLVPIAIPMIAGPAMLATVMLYAHTAPDPMTTFWGVIIAFIAASIVIVNSEKIKGLLGKGGIIALEKLMGMILVLISIQRFMEGIAMFYKTL